MNRLTERLHVKPECALTFLDPSKISHSHWNRVHEWAQNSPEFDHLKDAIQCIGGNVQPIKVRPNFGGILGHDTDAPDEACFEIVFGHSRLRACAELGLPVFAMVERLSDWEAVEQFAAEFRAHPSWRPWRLGHFLDRVIGTGLVPSIRKAGQALSMDLTDISLPLELVRLPVPIQRAYAEVPLQPNQGRKLLKAYQLDPESLSRNAIEKDFSTLRTAQAVFSALTERQA